MTANDILEQLHLRLREHGQCHVFIDRMADWPLREALASAKTPVLQTPLLTPIFEEGAEQSPLLVSLTRLRDEEWLEHYACIALEEALNPVTSTRSICAFIFSAQSPAGIAGSLQRWFKLRVPDLGNIYFRYFDPSVTRALARILQPPQWSELMKSFTHWYTLNQLGELEDHRPEVTNLTEEDRLAASAWKLSPWLTSQQWDQLTLAHAQHQACFALRRDGIDLTAAHLNTVGQLVQQAAAAGVASAEDRIAYARYGFHAGAAQFGQRDDVRQAIDFASRTGNKLADVLEQQLGLEVHGPALD